jgi:hypothetical protein
MLGRALSSATVTLLIGCLAAIPVRAQNLEAGKSPSQIFAGTCVACHKSPRGLLKTVPAGSLPGYLRQHYTTSSEMASLLSAFLVSNGAADTRYVGTKPTQQPKDAKPPVPEQLDRQGRPIRPAAPLQEAARPSDAQPAAKPDADGIVPQAEPGARQGRNARRLPRSPGEVPEAAKPAMEGQAPAQAAGEGGPDGRKSGAKQKLSKRGKPGGEESPKAGETPKAGAATGAAEPAKGETAKDDAAKSDTPKSETPKDDAGKPESAKPLGEGKSESTKVDAVKETGGETPALRADPVPPVTPAPPAAPAPTAAVPAAATTAANGGSEPAASPSVPAPPPAMTASVPPPPVAPAGPPVPPISH